MGRNLHWQIIRFLKLGRVTAWRPIRAAFPLMRRSKRHLYSITSSARATSDCGTVSPRVLAVVFRLMTKASRRHRRAAQYPCGQTQLP